MANDYDTPLHAPLQWKQMESQGRALDEAKTDAAIADLLKAEDPVVSESAEAHSVFPDLMPQDPADLREEHAGLGAVLRQKWIEFSGAA